MSKLSCKLLCELVHKNEKAQVLLCECFSFTPIKGLVAFNPIPAAIKSQISKDPSLLLYLQNAFVLNDSTAKQYERKRFWSFPEFKKAAPKNNSS